MEREENVMNVNETQRQDDTKKQTDIKSGVPIVETQQTTACAKQREALEWFRDYYIGFIHDADHNRQAVRKIEEALNREVI